MTWMISFGSYGGFYWYNRFTKRLCLGWMAITYFPQDDEFLAPIFKTADKASFPSVGLIGFKNSN